MDQSTPSEPVAIPANLDLEDKIAANLTGRQLIILCAGGLLIYGGYTAARAVLPLWVIGLLVVPVAAVVVALALMRRDGISLDRYALAALRHLANTRRPTHQTVGWGGDREGLVGGLGRGGWWARLRQPVSPRVLPAREVAQAGTFGVIDLGRHGLAALAVVSTVSWSLRSTTEQDALVATFGRWLHSLAAPVQILVRARPLDSTGHLDALARAVERVGEPALAAAAADHADHLAQLAEQHDLLGHQVLLAFREPEPPSPATSPVAQARRDRAALNRLARRLADATALLAPAGLTVTALNAEQAHDTLTTTCQPQLLDQPPTREREDTARFDEDGITGENENEDQGWYPLLSESRQR